MGIYLRPSGEHRYTVLDNLCDIALARLAVDGFAPYAVVETSVGSFQAWLKHAVVLPKLLGTLAAQTLAARYGADMSAADFRRSPESTPQKSTVAQVHEYADLNHRIAAVARAYAEHPSNTAVIAKDPAERRELNQLIRADLQAMGNVHRIASLFPYSSRTSWQIPSWLVNTLPATSSSTGREAKQPRDSERQQRRRRRH